LESSSFDLLEQALEENNIVVCIDDRNPVHSPIQAAGSQLLPSISELSFEFIRDNVEDSRAVLEAREREIAG
jgi:hypothetical protein